MCFRRWVSQYVSGRAAFNKKIVAARRLPEPRRSLVLLLLIKLLLREFPMSLPSASDAAAAAAADWTRSHRAGSATTSRRSSP